jgi:hypothetical protein
MKLLIIRKTNNPKDTPLNNKFFNELSRNICWDFICFFKDKFYIVIDLFLLYYIKSYYNGNYIYCTYIKFDSF